MRKASGLIAAVALLAAGPVGAANADTLVTNDSSGNYARYDGAVDATMASCSTGRSAAKEDVVWVMDPVGAVRARPASCRLNGADAPSF